MSFADEVHWRVVHVTSRVVSSFGNVLCMLERETTDAHHFVVKVLGDEHDLKTFEEELGRVRLFVNLEIYGKFDPDDVVYEGPVPVSEPV